MKLNLQTDFALRVLMLLAKEYSNQIVTASVVGQRLNIAKNHLSKIIAKLNQLDYIRATRGVGGGIRLKATPNNINIGQVISEFEPTLEVVNCKIPECPFLSNCKLKGILDDATLSFIDRLKTYTLYDIL